MLIYDNGLVQSAGHINPGPVIFGRGESPLSKHGYGMPLWINRETSGLTGLVSQCDEQLSMKLADSASSFQTTTTMLTSVTSSNSLAIDVCGPQTPPSTTLNLNRAKHLSKIGREILPPNIGVVSSRPGRIPTPHRTNCALINNKIARANGLKGNRHLKILAPSHFKSQQ